jgi:hypothetical protein
MLSDLYLVINRTGVHPYVVSGWLKVNRRFGATYRLQLQGRRAERLLATCFHAGFLLGFFIDPENGHVLPKRLLTSSRLHGVIFLKIKLFLTAV